MIYFDSAATSFLRPACVRRAIDHSLRMHAGYGRSGHQAAELAAKEVFGCRVDIASFFNLQEAERVVFCQNATHALNIALLGVELKKKGVVISGYEHNAVYRPLVERSVREGLQLRVVNSTLFDREDAVKAFDHALDSSCGLCVCTMVSNVFGNILPVEEIGKLCAERGICFIVDASQAAGSLPVDVEKLRADIVCMPGHKGLLGPGGTGLMLLCSDIRPKPLYFGGTGGDSASPYQPEIIPERYESGTLNVAGICGLHAGISYLLKHRMEILTQERHLIQTLRYALKTFSGVTVYGSDSESSGSLLSFTVRGRESEVIGAELAQRGIAVRAGLHCAPLAHRCVGTDSEGTVRVSVCGENTEAEVTRFCRTLWTILMRK